MNPSNSISRLRLLSESSLAAVGFALLPTKYLFAQSISIDKSIRVTGIELNERVLKAHLL